MSIQDFKFEPGMLVSHFRLEKLLGKGGMGAVYLAEDVTLSRQVAIKFMNREMLAILGTPEMKNQIEQRFIREAKSVAGMNHTNIAQVHEADFSTASWYIVMEFIEGKPLDELLKQKGPFLEKEALDILEQTVKGLKYAWDKCKIVHRDIKPGNLMFTDDGCIKIVDLGLAKPTQDEDGLDLTEVGAPVGTPFYMAPEQAVAGIIDYRADMFALGATVYELLTGNKTYPGKTSPMIYGKKIKKDYITLDSLYFEKNISLIIHRLLEPDDKDRYGDYEELMADIALIKDGKSLTRKFNEDTVDEMAETVDEKAAYGLSPDWMAETADEASKFKQQADPMAETLDEESIIANDPMAETADEVTLKSNETNKPTSGINPPADNISESIIAGVNSPVLPMQEKDMPNTQFGYSQLGDKPPKGSFLRLVLLMAILVVSLLIYLGNKKGEEQKTVEWPSLKWETILSAKKNWLYSYADQSMVSKLEQKAEKDPQITIFLSKMKPQELFYFLQIIDRNKNNKEFLNSPSKVVPELKSSENLANLDKALLQIKELEINFTKLELHREFIFLHEELKKFNPDVAEFKLKMKAENILQGYDNAANAKVWLKRFTDNDNLIKEIKAQKDWDQIGVKDLLPNYLSFVKSVNPYTDTLEKDIYNVSMTSLLNSLKSRKPEIKVSEFAKPLEELKASLDSLKKNFSPEAYSQTVIEMDSVKLLLDKGTIEEKNEFTAISKEILSLKPLEKQLTVSIEILKAEDSSKWPAIKVIPGFNAHCFYIKYMPGGGDYFIEHPKIFKEEKVSDLTTKQLRKLTETVTVEAICFSHSKDALAFYSLASSLTKKGSTSEIENFLKKLNPRAFARKKQTFPAGK